MNKKLLLIQPTIYDVQRNLVKKKKLYFTGLALPLLAALTPSDWEVTLCLETIEEIPWDTDADVVGISSMGHGVVRSIDIAKEFIKKGKTVIMGGYMVSLMPQEAKKHCHAVIVGDAEAVWSQVLNDLEAGDLKPFYQQELDVLSTPLPRYELLMDKNIGDFLPVQAGRGCPNLCSFCSVACLYQGKYIKREINEVLRDIQYIKSLGFKKFLLLDDNILSDRIYLEALCDGIKKLDMKWLSQCSVEVGRDPFLLHVIADSGCIALSFGLESISYESLKTLNKGWANPSDYSLLLRNIRMAGIDLSTEMVIGADGDTLSSIQATAGFIERNKIVVPRFYILTPIPGTAFYDEMDRAGRIVEHDIYSYNGSQAVHAPQNMTAIELTHAYWKLYERVFSIKSILKRTLMNTSLFRRPGSLIFYMFINFYYRYQIKKRIPPNII